ncbi:MAG TPA: hypothetical protein VHT75_08870 [Acidimicrobiales bacterium]|jgi:hypothetical protein|nr:hypothetical protein [Acidimicrobiales bacterium]
MVDAYYGPPELKNRVAAEAPRPPAELEARARRLLAALAADTDLDPARRHFLLAQVRGLRTTAAKLAGEAIGYVDEVEACYGVRPDMVPEDVFAAAHRRLDDALPGSGPLAERYVTWREAQAVPPDKLRPAVESLAEELRARTKTLWGLPDDEFVEFDLVTNEPWAGFNYYLGNLRSRVVINIDLPVLSTSLGHLVAHEAYPGHHTEHCRKEVGLVRRRRFLEETIFLVGTPQCLLAEGLADLGLEVVAGPRPEPVVAGHLQPLGIPYDADLVAQLSEAGQALGAVRGNAALLLHDRGAPVETVVDYLARWSLLSRRRAEKAVEFLVDPTWRAYVYCYIEGVARCRRFVAGDPSRFARLISEQLTPADLVTAG